MAQKIQGDWRYLSGSIGCCTRDEIRALFGEPDAVGGTSRKHGVSRIWKYGDLEFHFDGDVLALIFSETPEGIVDVSIPMRPQN